MIELKFSLEQHLKAVDYAESDLLIFKYNVEAKRILFCFDDLSEKIPEWVSKEKKVSYSFRYKIFDFQEVANFQRLEINNEQYKDSKNNFYIVRENLAIPILDIKVIKQIKGYEVSLCFDRGFGISDFYCQNIKVYELPFYFKNKKGDNKYYYVDLETKKDFDEQNFLLDLYQGKFI